MEGAQNTKSHQIGHSISNNAIEFGSKAVHSDDAQDGATIMSSKSQLNSSELHAVDNNNGTGAIVLLNIGSAYFVI